MSRHGAAAQREGLGELWGPARHQAGLSPGQADMGLSKDDSPFSSGQGGRKRYSEAGGALVRIRGGVRVRQPGEQDQEQ